MAGQKRKQDGNADAEQSAPVKKRNIRLPSEQFHMSTRTRSTPASSKNLSTGPSSASASRRPSIQSTTPGDTSIPSTRRPSVSTAMLPPNQIELPSQASSSTAHPRNTATEPSSQESNSKDSGRALRPRRTRVETETNPRSLVTQSEGAGLTDGKKRKLQNTEDALLPDSGDKPTKKRVLSNKSVRVVGSSGDVASSHQADSAIPSIEDRSSANILPAPKSPATKPRATRPRVARPRVTKPSYKGKGKATDLQSNPTNLPLLYHKDGPIVPSDVPKEVLAKKSSPEVAAEVMEHQLGYSKEDVAKAMELASNDQDQAIVYLITGFPGDDPPIDRAALPKKRQVGRAKLSTALVPANQGRERAAGRTTRSMGKLVEQDPNEETSHGEDREDATNGEENLEGEIPAHSHEAKQAETHDKEINAEGTHEENIRSGGETRVEDTHVGETSTEIQGTSQAEIHDEEINAEGAHEEHIRSGGETRVENTHVGETSAAIQETSQAEIHDEEINAEGTRNENIHDGGELRVENTHVGDPGVEHAHVEDAVENQGGEDQVTVAEAQQVESNGSSQAQDAMLSLPSQSPTPALAQTRGRRGRGVGTDEAETRPVSVMARRPPGRARNQNANPRLEACHIRMKELDTAYRRVLAFQKPALIALASRTQAKLERHKKSGKNSRRTQKLEARLEHAKDQRMGEIQQEYELKMKYEKRKLRIERRLVKHICKRRIEEKRADLLRHAELDMMRLIKKKESDPEITDDDELNLVRRDNVRNFDRFERPESGRLPDIFSHDPTDRSRHDSRRGSFHTEVGMVYDDWRERSKMQQALFHVDEAAAEEREKGVSDRSDPRQSRPVLPRHYEDVDPDHYAMSGDKYTISSLLRASEHVARKEAVEEENRLNYLANAASTQAYEKRKETAAQNKQPFREPPKRYIPWQYSQRDEGGNRLPPDAQPFHPVNYWQLAKMGRWENSKEPDYLAPHLDLSFSMQPPPPAGQPPPPLPPPPPGFYEQRPLVTWPTTYPLYREKRGPVPSFPNYELGLPHSAVRRRPSQHLTPLPPPPPPYSVATMPPPHVTARMAIPEAWKTQSKYAAIAPRPPLKMKAPTQPPPPPQ